MAARIWSWPVFRLVATDRCRVAAPWFGWTRADDNVSRLHRLAVELECATMGETGQLERAAAAALFLPLSLWAIAVALSRCGGALAAHYGISRVRQLGQMLGYAWRLNLPPRAYYQLRLHRWSWRRGGRYFLDQPELHFLQRHISPPDIGALEDKVRFTTQALAHNLPVAPVIAVWRDGQPRALDGTPLKDGLRRSDLFVKPSDGYSSAGVFGVRFDRSTGEFHDSTRRWTPAELHDYLARRSEGKTWLVQPWLENRADLQGFSETALCNLRVVTGRRQGGAPVPIMAALRFPWKSRITSSEPGITLCASIDLEKGTLRAAEARDPAIGRMGRHAQSGQQIEGFLLAGWRDALALAFAAHHAWPQFPFVGWDIAFTSQGLVLLEGGPLWGAALAQIAGSGPLGLTAFPRIYLSNLIRRTEAAVPPPAPVYAQSN